MPASRPERITALHDELTTLAAHLTAGEARFVELVAELERDSAWNEPGVLSCAHWLNFRCGLGMVAAREKVRVARALPELPAVAAAFARGEVSYSKVRAMTRVATPATESFLLNVARHGTAAQMEGLVRGYRRVVSRVEDAAEGKRQQGKRALHFQTWCREDGMVAFRGSLPAAEAELVAKALEGSVLNSILITAEFWIFCQGIISDHST
jgi:hypothetical protein